MWWLLLVGCATMRSNARHLNHQLERELIALHMRNDQLRDQLAHCAADPSTASSALHAELQRLFRDAEVTVQQTRNGVGIVLSADLLFAPSTSRIRAEAVPLLDLLVVFLRVHPEQNIIVTGHTDELPLSADMQQTYTDGWGLSTAQAAAVVRHFTDQHAIAAARFTVSGKGATVPVADSATPAGMARNRRIEILFPTPTGILPSSGGD